MPEAALLTLLANVSQRDRPLAELLALGYVDVPDVFALSRWA